MRHPLDRIEPTQALKLYKDEYDHLCEISPPIVKKVLKEFNAKFKKSDDLCKPEICSKLVPTNVYKMSDVEKCKNGHEYPKHFELECSECITLKISNKDKISSFISAKIMRTLY